MIGINIGIDLGTASTMIFVEGRGIVLSEPSAIAYDSFSGKAIAMGTRAYEMVGRNPESIRVVRPMRDGVISDFSAMQTMLRYYLSKICANMIFKPNVIICMPSTVTDLEKRTILELATSSGAGRACLIEEPLAAALGAGVEITQPSGTMIVDIGGGTADIAVITMGCIAVSKSIKVAGNLLNEDIMRYMKRERDALIGELTAEKLKMELGYAHLLEADLAVMTKGKNLITGMPGYFEISASDVYLSMREHLETIGEAVRSVLEITPPELAADISTKGIYLTGGGALLRGIDMLIKRKTGVEVRVAPDPLNCVVQGIGCALKHMDILTDNGCFFKTGEEVKGYRDRESKNYFFDFE